jgi:dTDP-4-dehydrorhamnose reductase
MDGERHPWLVIGADGAIGGELLRTLRSNSMRTVGTTRRTDAEAGMMRLDLAAEPANWPLRDRFDVAFLCAAVTSIERCRQNPAESRLVNVERTLRLARTLLEWGTHVVFPSTNHVFDGTHACQKPDAATRPRTDYGRQKAEIERELLTISGATIVRFTKVIPRRMKLLCDWAASLKNGQTITPFHDMYLSPVPLAFAVGALQRIGERKPGGIVHVSGECDVSYAEVATLLARRLGVSPGLVQPISFASAGIGSETAPPNTTLDAARLVDIGLAVPSVWNTIEALIEGAVRD